MVCRAVIALALLAAAHGAVLRGQTVNTEVMRPEVVAMTLARVEDEWKAEATDFTTVCADKTDNKDCLTAPAAFTRSCATVVSAVVQGSGGDRKVAKEYMANVCGQKALAGWHKLRCTDLASAIVERAMTADNYANRETMNSGKLCTSFWSKFVDAERKREAAEAIERAAREKKEAEEAAIAKAKAEADAKIEAERKAKEEVERLQKEKEQKAKQAAEEAKARAVEAAAKLAEKKAEAEKVAKAAQEKLEEAAKAEAEHLKLKAEHEKTEQALEVAKGKEVKKEELEKAEDKQAIAAVEADEDKKAIKEVEADEDKKAIKEVEADEDKKAIAEVEADEAKAKAAPKAVAKVVVAKK